MEIPTTPGTGGVDFVQARSVFETALELNDQIVDQNSRLATAQTEFGNDTELLELIELGIAEEQQETFLALTEATKGDNGTFYKSIGVLALSVDKDLEESAQSVANLEREAEAKSQEIETRIAEERAAEMLKHEQLLNRIKELSPGAVEDAQKLIESRLKNLSRSEAILALEDVALDLFEQIEGKREQVNDLTAMAGTVGGLSELGMRPWAVPRALKKVLGEDAKKWVTIDELPVEVTLNEQNAARHKALRSVYPRVSAASLYATLYLSDRALQTVTVDEVAEFLYGAPTYAKVSDWHKRSRVTTLLRPTNQYLHEPLLSEGYFLQYGWRRTLVKASDGSVKTARPPQRIYRPVPLADPSMLQQEDAAVSEKTVANQITSDRFDPVHNIDELVERWKEDPRRREEVAAKLARVARQERVPEWIKELKTVIGDVLNELERLELLSNPEGELLKVARKKVPGPIFGSPTSIRQILEANLLGGDFRTVDSGQWGELKVTPAEIVIMRMFKTHQVLAGANGRHRQEQAVKAIEEAVNAFFARRERERRRRPRGQ